MGGGDGEVDHRVHFVALQEAVDGHRRDAVGLGLRLGERRLDVGAGDDLHALEERRETEIGVGDVAAADDADAVCPGHDAQPFFRPVRPARKS
jgi:hypothetical protein